MTWGEWVVLVYCVYMGQYILSNTSVSTNSEYSVVDFRRQWDLGDYRNRPVETSTEQGIKNTTTHTCQLPETIEQ